ncbi:hypothetical protein JJV70_02490 [Streptomyces sp. JJ66]|uniref:hypothetical protein n=1 Tax=Streptomyces sp. JJ66 TaxID=2803843 RepID=UPI001C5889AD|nr:hypothetical protein [Streptomyces sp. JJ66]MBW1600990.1 hypothetical protein [Streptomyces sp. JJ66]
MHEIALYLARRDAYAAYLSAAEAECGVAHHRIDGRFANDTEAVAAVDQAYAATRAAFNVLAVEGEDTGPVKQARTLNEVLRTLHSGGGHHPDWAAFRDARDAFLAAAADHLKSFRIED